MARKVLCHAFCLFFFAFGANLAKAQEAPVFQNLSTSQLSAPGAPTIATIEILVRSAAIKLTYANGLEETFKAGTASSKNTKGLPFDKKGYLWKVALNPSWTVPSSIIQEERTKGHKIKNFYRPNEKGNPLGKIKLFIEYGGYNSSLGIHGTNNPKSVGRRVSHGCNRLEERILFAIARSILTQNGYDADALFAQAAQNPKNTIAREITNGPEIYYRNY